MPYGLDKGMLRNYEQKIRNNHAAAVFAEYKGLADFSNGRHYRELTPDYYTLRKNRLAGNSDRFCHTCMVTLKGQGSPACICHGK
jgi:hypothetical protein